MRHFSSEEERFRSYLTDACETLAEGDGGMAAIEAVTLIHIIVEAEWLPIEDVQSELENYGLMDSVGKLSWFRKHLE